MSRKNMELVKFIKAYENLPELWDTRNIHYNNRNKRDAAIDKLREILLPLDPTATDQSVKRKINILRVVFRKEMKRREELRKAGADFKPGVWYYKYMTFLLKDGVLNRKKKSVNNTIDDCAIVTVRSTPTPELVFADHSFTSHQFNDTSDTHDSAFTPKIRCAMSAQSPNTDDDDPALTLAKNYALKLGRVESAEQQMIADKLINHVLFDAQLGLLNRHSHLVHQPQLSAADSAASKRTNSLDVEQLYNYTDIQTKHNDDSSRKKAKISESDENDPICTPDNKAQKSIGSVAMTRSSVNRKHATNTQAAGSKTENALTCRQDRNNRSTGEVEIATSNLSSLGTRLEQQQRQSQNEYQSMGIFWGLEVQKMSRKQQIYAKKAIHDILFEGQIGALHIKSSLIKPKC